MTASPKVWLRAMRLRTLPLAAASILAGCFVAAQNGVHRPVVTVLAIVTAFLFQILSNLANDYGDFVHGADSDARIGPSRAVQSGAISPQAMRIAMWITGTSRIGFSGSAQRDRSSEPRPGLDRRFHRIGIALYRSGRHLHGR